MRQEVTQYLSSKDDVLKQVITEVDWPEITSTQNVFHDLTSCVIEQQIHYRSSKKTFAKLLTKSSIEELTVDSFEVFEERALGDVKLSMRKYETVIEVVDFFHSHSPDWSEMSNTEVRETLSSIKGIGQ